MQSFGNNAKKEAPRILIVDDDLDIVTTVKMFLELEGFQTASCHDGRSTLAFIEKQHVDLILLDLVLPDMCGIEVACHIKKLRFIPIIMVSARDQQKDKIEGLKYANDYVTKPFSFEELSARINALLRISQLQNELRISTTRYQCLYENIPEMCISLDKERILCDCNTMFCSCFRRNKEELIHKSVSDFFHPKEHETLDQFFRSIKPQDIHENSHIFQLSHQDGAGNPIYVTARAICLGEHETGLYYIVAMKDISHNLELEKQQNLARQHLYRSARLASIGTLASGTAHEMNNPLTAILGFSDALIQRLVHGEAVSSDELIQYLGVIHSESLRCRDVVENLSKFSRDYESYTEQVFLYNCIHSALTLLNVEAQKKGIIIKNTVAASISVNANAQKIIQVLVNILTNAIDFCDSGCIVIIESEECHDESEQVYVRIIDNGPGIAEEIAPKIFDPFFTTKEVGKGMGLGLSISHKLMEECNGSIDIVSKKGCGTTVFLEFPRFQNGLA
ncbi:MAG: response regulator [Chitinivibrionales bacterium]|nr:response regulator [Chitinivibrionales bacterium]